VCGSLEWLLESANLLVRSFGMVRQFRAAYRPTDPSGIVLDVRMPGMSGIELQKQLAVEGVTVPFIFISGHGDLAEATIGNRQLAI